MRKLLWKLPTPCSGRCDDDVIQGPQRTWFVHIKFDHDDSDTFVLTFTGVEAARVLYDGLCVMEWMSDVYSALCDLGETDWLKEARGILGDAEVGKLPLRHLAIYLDDGPYYEFLCRGFSVVEPPTPTDTVIASDLS